MSFQTDIKSTGDFQKEIVEVPGTLQGGDWPAACIQGNIELAWADVHAAQTCKLV